MKKSELKKIIKEELLKEEVVTTLSGGISDIEIITDKFNTGGISFHDTKKNGLVTLSKNQLIQLKKYLNTL